MGTSSRALRKSLVKLAECQGGYFTAQQAISVGYNDAVHGYHVKAGHWERAGWGIYRLTCIPKTQWSDLHRILLWSRSKKGMIRGAFCGRTAEAIRNYDAEIYSPVCLCVPKNFRKSSAVPANVKLIFKDLCEDEIEIIRGLRVCAVLDDEDRGVDDINPKIGSGFEDRWRSDFAEIIRRGED